MLTEGEFEPAERYEVFCDTSYFDLWALRPIGEKDFNLSLHFAERRDAVFASHVIAAWNRRVPAPSNTEQ